MKRILIPICFTILSIQASAQATNCAQTLRLAQSVYDQGRLHELEDIINKGLAGGDCDTQTKVSLYKLLTLAYIYLEEPQKADDSMLKLLQTDHYFEINQAVDPAEFVALYNTFRTHEIYRVGAKLGVNASQPNVTQTITAVELSPDSKYTYGIAILFGGVLDVPINGKMTLHGELLYLQRKFNIYEKSERGSNTAGQPLTNELVGIESQNWLSLPVSFEYKFAEKKYNPYVAGGVSIDYLLNAQLKGQRIRTDVTSVQETTFDLNPQRNKVNVSLLAAAGIKLKMGGGYFVAELRYLYGITNVNSSETSYANEQAAWEQGYADSVFKMSTLMVNGSYVLNIFDPQKKKIKISQ